MTQMTTCDLHNDTINKLQAKISQLEGECRVLADILRDAYEVTKVIEADDSAEADSLWQLNYAIATAIGPYAIDAAIDAKEKPNG